MTSLLAFLVVFGLVVIVHEAGHFCAAKLAGIKVYEFSIGFGPQLLAKRIRGTLYRLNLLPLGGLVRLAGLDDSPTEKARASERYTSKSWFARAAVLISGPLMNFVLAFFIFIIMFSMLGVPESASNRLSSVVAASPAAAAGWHRGDIVSYFNGRKVTDMSAVVKEIRASRGQALTFVITRGELTKTYILRGVYDKKQDLTLIGIQLEPLSYKRFSPLKALTLGVGQTYGITIEIFRSLGHLFTGAEKISNFAGPLGIAKLSGEAAERGIYMFLTFIAILSINLGVLNFLPIPALDGGRLVFLVLEKVLPRKISVEKEQLIHYLGFAFLLLLALVITMSDLKRMFNL